MKLDSISIKGVLRFHDPVTLNFRDLPPGLIAIVGPNGAGKTTIMDTVFGAAFRHFPSRDGELFDYATRADAHLETAFELEGRGSYRARVNLDGPHRKAEAVLVRTDEDGRSQILNDGKVSTFDAAIATILPPMTDLLASVFAAQNRRGGFSALDRKGKRELFASLLGLDHIEAMAERARQAVSRVSLEVDRLTARREILDRSVTAEIESSLEQRAQQLQITAGSVDARRAELQRLVVAAEASLVEYREAADRYAKAVADGLHIAAEWRTKTAEKDSVAEGLRRLEADVDQQIARLDANLTSATARFQADEADLSIYETEIRQIDARQKAIIDDATKRIAANDALKKDAAVIRAAVARVDGIYAASAKVEEKRADRADQLASLRKRERVLLDVLGVIRERENALAYAEQNAAAIERAPFGEQCAPCAFMANASTARAEIPALREAIASKATAEEDLRGVQAQIADAEVFITTCLKDALELRREREAHQPKASELPHLTAAEEKIAGHQKRIADAEADAARDRAEAAHRRDQRILRLRTEQANRKDEYAGAVTVLTEAANTRRAELHANAVAISDRLEVLEAERTAARATVDRYAEPAGKAAEQDSLLGSYRREWDETTATRATVAAQLDEQRRQVALFTEIRKDRDSVADRLATVRADLVEWQVLAKALGREGLQTLEIDAAGPTVSAFANDLLQACYGGRFTLELVTQAPKVTKGKDGSTHKEVFEANVYDQLRGGEKRDLADLSGGERVIVEEVLRSSIALLVNTRNQHPIRTAWRDETTGALDAENAERYIDMLRRVQQIGGFHQILFVTHNADCARLADAQVQVADGAVLIALPPFLREVVAA